MHIVFKVKSKESCRKARLFQFAEKLCFFKKSAYSQSLSPNPFPRDKGLCMLCWLCIVQSLWAYTPGIRARAECGAAALTKQGRLQSVAHSRCTTQRHRRLTPRLGATPQTPFSKIYRFFDSLQRVLPQGKALFPLYPSQKIFIPILTTL